MNKLLDHGLIHPYKAPYGALVLFQKKKHPDVCGLQGFEQGDREGQIFDSLGAGYDG